MDVGHDLPFQRYGNGFGYRKNACRDSGFVRALRQPRAMPQLAGWKAMHFVHKLKVALQEVNETSVWLRIACTAGLMQQVHRKELIDENQLFCKILNAWIKTQPQ